MFSKTHEYNRAGDVSKTEADELVEFVNTFRQEVIDWLKKNRPQLLKR
jgi:hypothetical protein